MAPLVQPAQPEAAAAAASSSAAAIVGAGAKRLRAADQLNGGGRSGDEEEKGNWLLGSGGGDEEVEEGDGLPGCGGGGGGSPAVEVERRAALLAKRVAAAPQGSLWVAKARVPGGPWRTYCGPTGTRAEAEAAVAALGAGATAVYHEWSAAAFGALFLRRAGATEVRAIGDSENRPVLRRHAGSSIRPATLSCVWTLADVVEGKGAGAGAGGAGGGAGGSFRWMSWVQAKFGTREDDDGGCTEDEDLAAVLRPEQWCATHRQRDNLPAHSTLSCPTYSPLGAAARAWARAAALRHSNVVNDMPDLRLTAAEARELSERVVAELDAPPLAYASVLPWVVPSAGVSAALKERYLRANISEPPSADSRLFKRSKPESAGAGAASSSSALSVMPTASGSAGGAASSSSSVSVALTGGGVKPYFFLDPFRDAPRANERRVWSLPRHAPYPDGTDVLLDMYTWARSLNDCYFGPVITGATRSWHSYSADPADMRTWQRDEANVGKGGEPLCISHCAPALIKDVVVPVRPQVRGCV